MSKGLLTKKDLQDAIGWQIISPGFAVDVAKLIDAYEELAAQQGVQADGAYCSTEGGNMANRILSKLSVNVDAPKEGTLYRVVSVVNTGSAQLITLEEVVAAQQMREPDKGDMLEGEVVSE